MAAPIILGALNLYNWNEGRLIKKYNKQYEPTPLPIKPAFFSSDVSIVVPTISTEDWFATCLRLWLDNEPKEVIIVTIARDLEHVEELLKSISDCPGRDKVRVITVEKPSKREQLVAGLKEVKGKIVAMIDDDTFPSTKKTLEYLMAPLEDPQVGATGGPQFPYVPAERMNTRDITMWEAAGIRAIHGTTGYMIPRLVADGGCWCLVGRTIIVRANIVQDPDFYEGFTKEMWFGHPLNTGDDNYITRYIQLIKGWKIGYQDQSEAAVVTTIKKDIGYFYQMIRWKRSSCQMLISTLFMEPGFWAVRLKHPYMARKMAERVIKPTLTWVQIVAWLICIRTNPVIAFIIAAYHLHGYHKSYASFLRAHPYCCAQLLGIIMLDHVPLFLEPYLWLTVHKDAWLTRDDHVDEDVQPEAQDPEKADINKCC